MLIATQGCKQGDDPEIGTGGGQDQAHTSVTIPIVHGVVALGARAFGENPLSLVMGTAVTWLNEDSAAHSVVSVNSEFDSGAIQPGSVWSFTFLASGTYRYHCQIHGEAAESGMIVVY